MKKFTALLGLLALCGGTMMASPIENSGVRTDLKVTGTTAKFNQLKSKIESGKIIGEVLATRDYTDPAGDTYVATFQRFQEPLCDMLTFSDADGNPFKPTFDELPYYVVSYTLVKYTPNSIDANTYINFMLEWPSEYIYRQLFTYQGEKPNGIIPVEFRDYTPAPFSDLWNNPEYCREFREDEGVGSQPNATEDNWLYYGMLPNEALGIACLYDDVPCFTKLDENTYSKINLELYSMDDNVAYLEFRNDIRIDFQGSTRRVRPTYKGTGDVQGFDASVIELPEFGDMHLFNTGVVSSAKLGDENPFPTDFPEMTQFYYTISDKRLEWSIDPAATSFNPDMIKLMVPEGTARDVINFMYGYAFADPKYGNDINLNPDEQDMSFVQGEVIAVDLGEDSWYAEYTPAVGDIVPFNIADAQGNMEPWSAQYGTRFYVDNMPESTQNTPVSMGWGFKTGWELSFENLYLRTYKANSTGKLFYHYDPTNINLVRELELVGGKDGVELVEVKDGAAVYAANGEIVVVPSENAAVAIYGLDGVCHKNVKAAAGESVSIEAPKGIYVVTVNGAARKVAL